MLNYDLKMAVLCPLYKNIGNGYVTFLVIHEMYLKFRTVKLTIY